MASPNLQTLIRNLFQPNLTESISAEDMQIFVDGIFQASESIIRKFQTPQELDDFRNSDPDVKMLKGDLCVITDKPYSGIYISKINQPFFTDMVLLSDENSILNDGGANQMLYSIQGVPTWGKVPDGYFIKGTAPIKNILQQWQIPQGTIYIASETDPTASIPGTKGDGYSWDGYVWSNIGSLVGPKGEVSDIAFATQSEVDIGNEIDLAVSPSTLKNSSLLTSKEFSLGKPHKDGMILSSGTNGVREWVENPAGADIDSLGNVNLFNPVKSQRLTFDGIVWKNENPTLSGRNTERPLNPLNGTMYFDINVGLPIWWNEGMNKWITADGTQI
jgi:hypothetical protein